MFAVRFHKKNITDHYKNAKINTCQIQPTTKTLKFVLANNSSLKVYDNYTGRIYAKVKMRVNPIIYSFNCNEYLYLDVRVSSCHQPRHAKASILLVHF